MVLEPRLIFKMCVWMPSYVPPAFCLRHWQGESRQFSVDVWPQYGRPAAVARLGATRAAGSSANISKGSCAHDHAEHYSRQVLLKQQVGDEEKL